MSKKLGCIGEALTIIYFAGLISLAIYRWDDVRALDLNELGDALAGAIGPLALVWLVLGYFQQGEELRLNTEALKLQAEELKASVKQQELLVQANEATLLAAERPILTVSAAGGQRTGQFKGIGLFMLRFPVENAGRTHAMKVRVTARIVVAPHDNDLKLAWEKLQEDEASGNTEETFGIVVAPNTTREVPQSLWLDREETARARDLAARNNQFWPRTCVLGFVRYESIMASEHMTSFGFEIGVDGTPNERIPNTPTLDVPNAKLKDLPWIAGPTT